MLICEKFNEKRLEEITYMIAAAKANCDKDRCIVCEEVKPFINDIYYIRDTETDSILAIIVGGFGMDYEVIPYRNPFPVQVIYYDPSFLVKHTQEELDQNLTWLVKEFCVDKNSWAVEYTLPDSSALASDDPHILRALRANGFVRHKDDEKKYSRIASTINYDTIYH